MSIITPQQITSYYDRYRDTELTFTKDIIRTLALDPRQIYVKCNGDQWPCIINSTSYLQARIIVGTKSGAYDELCKKDINNLQIRFGFMGQDGQPIAFFVTCTVDQISQYMNSTELAIVTLNFTQRPPDTLIELTGKLLEANENSIRRREERIAITEDSKRILGLPSEKLSIIVQGLPRNCVLRDISFSGAKIVIMGLAQFLTGKEAQLSLDFTEPQETVTVKGTIVAAEPIEGRKDIVSANIKFEDEDVPLSYKLHLNDYMTSSLKKKLSAGEEQEAKRKAEEERNKMMAQRKIAELRSN